MVRRAKDHRIVSGRSSRGTWCRLTGGALFAFALFAGISPAEADILQRTGAEISELEGKMAELQRLYLSQALIERRHQLAARLSEGQLYFLTQEYDRAAMVLLDVVEAKVNENQPGYSDALYYLSESLFQTRNYNAATRYFTLVAQGSNRGQRQDAVGRLLEIALVTHDTESAKRYLAQANVTQSDTDHSLRYSVAKYHYQTGELDRARGLFGQVARGHQKYRRARYFLGVVALRQRRNADALVLFTEALEAAPAVGSGAAELATDLEVQNEARLAIARLHYETGNFIKAVEAYAAVPRDVVAFDAALYESVWIAIKQAQYEKALRKLEVQLISQPDVLKGPDARLLQGKLLMMLERYEDASLAFQEVKFEFGPLQSEMKAVVDENHGDLETYFNRLIGKNIASFDLGSFLPTRAAEFAGPDVEADRALVLVGDLAAQKRDLLDAKKTIDRLNAALDAPNRIEIFPKLHEGWLRALELEYRVAVARGSLNEAAGESVRSAPEYGTLRKARMAMAKRFAEVPRTVTELQARDQRVDDAMQEVDQNAFKLDLEIRGLEAQLLAIDKYVQDTRSTYGGESLNRAVLAQVERELSSATALRDELIRLKKQIEAERVQVGVNDYASREDSRIKARYLAAVEAEARWLQTHNAAPSQAARRQLDILDRRLGEFFRRADEIVVAEVADIKRQLNREVGNVDAYDGRLLTFQGQTESLGGAIAARSFGQVLGRIDAVVLEADVGLIDVAWKQKQDKTGQISKMLSRQSDELEQLGRNFNEVTGD